MTRPRRSQVSLADTPYYHCIARYVRRAFLCGDDHYSGKSFEHRRQWLVDRIALQASAYSIDVCAFAVMSNHYHLVLRVDAERAGQWTDDEVLERWCRLYKGPLLVQRYLAGDTLLPAQLDTVADSAKVFRERLSDLSWFMGGINEFIARRANAEDCCKGRFWEGRFISQALLDETAVLACMAYVDLNPVRAGICSDLEGADFTSVQARLREITRKSKPRRGAPANKPTMALLPFAETEHSTQAANALPFTLKDYIDLVDWTGRAARADKRGFIPDHCPPVVNRLGLDEDQWLVLALDIQKQSLQAIGGLEAVQRYSQSMGKRWLSGQRNLARAYRSSA